MGCSFLFFRFSAVCERISVLECRPFVFKGLSMPAISPEAQQVQYALQEKGLETPLKKQMKKETRRAEIQQKMYEVLTLIGLDLENDSLKESPARLAKMYVDEIFLGLDYANFPKITKVKNQMRVSERVQVNDIRLTSICEHHFVTIDGQVSIAYYPKNWVIGLSKLNRIVDFFAKRPQVQERFTEQVLLALQTILGTDDVAVYVKATHFCVKARGIQDENSYTITSAYGGVFKAGSAPRQEFLASLSH